MKRIISMLGVLVVVVALVGYVFNLADYDFMAQLEKISNLRFNNFIADFNDFYDKLTGISKWASQNIEWYEYIPKFFNWLGNLIMLPINTIKNIALTIFNGLKAVLYLLGF